MCTWLCLEMITSIFGVILVPKDSWSFDHMHPFPVARKLRCWPALSGLTNSTEHTGICSQKCFATVTFTYLFLLFTFLSRPFKLHK